MKSGKGAIPKHQQRSTKTPRTPPPQNNTKADESIYQCEVCLIADHEDKVCCDSCHLWYHFKCVNVDSSVATRRWDCIKCQGEPQSTSSEQITLNPTVNPIDNEGNNPLGAACQTGDVQVSLGRSIDTRTTAQSSVVNPSSSVVRDNKSTTSRKASSTASSINRRTALALQRLEEEKFLYEKRERENQERRTKYDKEYLDKKYSLLVDDPNDDIILADDELDILIRNRTEQWSEQATETNRPLGGELVHQEINSSTNWMGDVDDESIINAGRPLRRSTSFRSPIQSKARSERFRCSSLRSQPSQKSFGFTKWFKAFKAQTKNMPVSVSSRSPVSTPATISTPSVPTSSANINSVPLSSLSLSVTQNSNVNATSRQMSSVPNSSTSANIQSFVRSTINYSQPIMSNPTSSSNTSSANKQTYYFGLRPTTSNVISQSTVTSVTTFSYTKGVHTVSSGSQQVVTFGRTNPLHQSSGGNAGNNRQSVSSFNVIKTPVMATSHSFSNGHSSYAPSTVVNPYRNIDNSSERHNSYVPPNSTVVNPNGNFYGSSNWYAPPRSSAQASTCVNPNANIHGHPNGYSSYNPPHSSTAVISNASDYSNGQNLHVPPNSSTIGNANYSNGQNWYAPPHSSAHTSSSVNPNANIHGLGHPNGYSSYNPPHSSTVVISNASDYSNGQNLHVPPNSSNIGNSNTNTYGSTSHGYQSYTPNNNITQSNVTGMGAMPAGMNDGVSTHRVRLTSEQIAARHVIPKLPHFFGDPRYWQAFNSAFEYSTSACGFSNVENLGRLQDSLKGAAETAVKGRLLHPDAVPAVMNTLKMLYGRPEVIIETMIDDIKKEPSPKDDDLPSLIKFAVSVQNLCGSIQETGALDHLRNPTLMNAITDKLPTQIQLNWAYYRHSIGIVDLSTLGNWLYELADIASQVVRKPSAKVGKKKEKDDKRDSEKSINYLNTQVENNSKNQDSRETGKKVKCLACKSESCSRISTCKKFKSFSRSEKWTFVKENKLCSRCLGAHSFYRCRSDQSCKAEGCTKKHHTILHDNENTAESSKKKTSRSENKSTDSAGKPTSTCNSQRSIKNRNDVFRIVPVVLYNKTNVIRDFAYLDDGSNLTLMEDELANELELVGTPQAVCIDWAFGQSHESEKSRIVTVKISGFYHQAPSYKLDNVRTVKNLHLPTQSMTSEWLEQYPHLKSIPIGTYESVKPRMLIGLQYSKLTVSLETIEGAWEEPMACRTRIGWVVQGPSFSTSNNNQKKFSLNLCQCQSQDNQLHKMVQEYFSIENFGVTLNDKFLESKEIQRARQILESTTVKKNGRYQSGLLWKYDKIDLPNSYNMAFKRLQCLESKMAKTPQLAENLCTQIKQFLEKGYVRKLSPNKAKHDRVWYLPIFTVFNPKKPEKVRIVWDAAAKVKNVSLNSMLLTGPDLLVPLVDILRRFRERSIAVLADIKEMYHQIEIIEQDQQVQRFLWRDGDASKEPEAKSIIENTYVDDLLDCVHELKDAVKLVKDVKFVNQQGGFDTRNFLSNSKELLEKIGEHTNQPSKNLNMNNNLMLGTERVLGMFWNTETDNFTYSLKYTQVNENILTGIHIPTKREMLRILMSIFDPLGLLANFLVYAKILIQETWRQNIDWDEPITDALQVKWIQWITVLRDVEKVQIPRLYSPKLSPGTPKSIQLHIFVDAGGEAFAASAYLRIKDDDGVDCCLVGAKTKVAPNKPMSIPRLELQAAVLGTRLSGSVKTSLRLEIEKTIFWSDSQNVMGWINSETRRYHQFVAFRIGEILESTESKQWRWVPSEHNAVDEATKSKGIKNKLDSTSCWFKGPKFLYDEDSTWFIEENEYEHHTQEELRPSFVMACRQGQEFSIVDVKRFSNWNRLVRAMAYVFRFIYNIKATERRTGPLLQEEIVQGENQLYRIVQQEHYLDEIAILEQNAKVQPDEQKYFDKSSELYKCSPYLDGYGVLRVKGRLDAAKCLSRDTKRPIILPRRHYVTKLIVNWYHCQYLHLNHQTALNEIMQKYDIPALRVVMKEVRNACQKCKNDSAVPQIPEMAELPYARLAAYERPYTFVGVDYFGPFKVKITRNCSSPRWGVLFTCLTTRAVHLEVAHSLSTSSCIMAFERFGTYCGFPREVYSDNGSNFHGMENELKEEFKRLNQDEIQKTFTNAEMKWSFKPPLTPHMGGAWERLVRTVKSCFKKIVTTRKPTDETLPTLFAHVENIVNSRPLTYLSLDSTNDEALTPNHFLFGSSNGRKPMVRTSPKDLNKNDWKNIQEQTNQFWRRFVLEYMPTLTKRTKWFKQSKPIKVGDVVIIVDEKNPRNTWPKGIVEQVIVGKGGKRRQAIVRAVLESKNGPVHKEYRRSVHKLAVLDVKMPADEEVNQHPVESNNGGETVGQH